MSKILYDPSDNEKELVRIVDYYIDLMRMLREDNPDYESEIDAVNLQARSLTRKATSAWR